MSLSDDAARYVYDELVRSGWFDHLNEVAAIGAIQRGLDKFIDSITADA